MGRKMFLKSIHIWNYRLLKDVELSLDTSLTLLVGKNNAGKTSFMHFIQQVNSGKKNLDFSDYPITCREILYSAICEYWNGIIDFTKLQEKIPTTKLRFTVDYSNEKEDDMLGGLSPFIIDLEEDKSEAIVEVEYKLFIKAEEITALFELYNELQDNLKRINLSDTEDNVECENLEPSDKFDISIVSNIVRDKFKSFFEINIRAINPSNENDFQVKNLSLLNDLFVIKNIEAERNLDESENASIRPLSALMTRLFENDLKNIEGNIEDATGKLVSYVSGINAQAQVVVNELLEDIVNNMMQFGYPTAEELQLQANTKISLKNEIINNTDLTYTSSDTNESLPSTHNGLGYKNLIKISFLLQEFTKVIATRAQASIPLLFIEEPEAHMHPQLQSVFVKYLENVIEKMNGNRIQIIMSTHSSHVANSVPFSKIRYMRRHKNYIVCKNLEEYYSKALLIDEKKKDLDFLRKYMTLSRCDLYFCDKAILIEGAAERLLIPDMINKCEKRGFFTEKSPALSSQYCSLIEVGGAYAHRFFEMVDFLEIPTLILTDIDFVDIHGKSCQKQCADRTSNSTIIRWCHDVFNIPISNPIKIDKVNELAMDEQKRTNGLRHIEFQVEENGYHPRSLEESIINVNRKEFGLADNIEEITFDDENEKKTNFAIRLLVEEEFDNYKIPLYIKNGLIWLNQQSEMPDTLIPKRKEKRRYTKKVEVVNSGKE